MALSPLRKSSRLVTTTPLYDFLVPSFTHQLRLNRLIHNFSTTTRSPSITPPQNPPTPPSQNPEPKTPQSPNGSRQNPPSPHPSKPLTEAQKDFLTKALRVNQAGELAATLIYTHQTPPLVASHPHLRPLLHHMYTQEASHLQTFNTLLARHRIRPTAMYPLWTLAASALGWGTALLGREAAMACTEAVETEIGSHYNEQVRALLAMTDEMEAKGEEVGGDLRALVGDIRRIRDEELEHLDHAVENDARKAVPHELLTGVIRAGCRAAIWVTERS